MCECVLRELNFGVLFFVFMLYVQVVAYIVIKGDYKVQ